MKRSQIHMLVTPDTGAHRGEPEVYEMRSAPSGACLGKRCRGRDRAHQHRLIHFPSHPTDLKAGESAMTYRFPIVVGDRVALAPHLDLWMAGVRFGTVRGSTINARGEREYHIMFPGLPSRWLSAEDLLGAVGERVRVAAR